MNEAVNPQLKGAVAARPEEVVIDLRDVVIALLRGSWLIVLFALVGGYFGVQEVHRYVPKYEAKMILAPPEGSDGGSATSGSLLLSTIGINVDGGSRVTPLARLKQILSSHELARRLQERHGLMQLVFHSSWDERTRSWIPPAEEPSEYRRLYRDYFHQPKPRTPDIEALAKYVGGMVTIKEDPGAPFFRLQVLDRDRDFALFLLRTTYEEADKLLREQDREQVLQKQAYLRAQLEKPSIVDIREMLIGMLRGEVRRAMLLASDLPYAARIIEPARVSAAPTSPNVLFDVGWRMLVGAAIALVIVVGFFAARRMGRVH